MICRSPFPDVDIPDDVTLTDFVLCGAAEYGDKPALINGATDEIISFTEFAAAVSTVAAGLARRGFNQGDVFAFYAANSPEYAIAFLAVAQLGGTVTTVNPLYTVGELGHQLEDSGASFLIANADSFDRASAAARAAGVTQLYVFGKAEGATPFADLMVSERTTPSTEQAAPAAPVDPRTDLVALPYSSGTTGLAKGVMLTHYNLIANLQQIAGVAPGTDYAPTEDDTLIGVLPFFHIYGMIMMLLSLMRGCTLVTLPRFELEHFLSTLERYKVTYAHMVPPIVLLMSKHPTVDEYSLLHLRQVICGAAPLGKDVATDAAERLGVQVNQAWGMTELSPVGHMNPDPAETIDASSVGPCVPNAESKIIDVESGKMLGPNERGELCQRGPHVMVGYLNAPEATAHCIDEEKWLHTGDIAYANEAGYVWVVDRAKELIKYKGFQVAPAELEALILTHESVADVAVIGVQDEEAGELPKAFVVPKDVAPEDVNDRLAADIQSFVAKQVAHYKKIRTIEFIEAIPKSASGKILRRELIERQRAG
jgi:acyl-CoA synthetase (AMP-forming)/AMP-acid ligase II